MTSPITIHHARRWVGILPAIAFLSLVTPSHAEDATVPQPPAEEPRHELHYSPVPADSAGAATAVKAAKTPDVRADVPIVTYTYTSYGATAKTVGAQGFAQGLFASGQNSTLGGGATVWGSPVDRLTIVVDAQRNFAGDFSPSAALVVRIVGDAREGWSLGGLGKFKVDGFAAGPNKDEVESEVELGALVSFNQRELHLDMNAIAGRGLGDDGETDTEGRLRFGYDLGRLARVGLDGQARVRVGGPKYLPNGRIWDFAAGPQVVIGSGHFYGALTAGPSTTGTVTSAVGFASVLTVGGTT